MTATPERRAGWTARQLEAMGTRGCNVLVSASAGTGKTAVLVERVIRNIVDPATGTSIDRLLVVTFTDAAAAEMRERVNQALLKRALAAPDDAWLAGQLALLPRAHISTLHSWCLALVRENFHRLGLDPAMRVLDEHEAELLRLEVLDDLFEDRYEHEDQAFLDLVDRYGDDRGDEPLRRLVLDLHSFVRGLPDLRAWLARSADAFAIPEAQPLLETPWGDSLRSMLSSRLQLAIASLRDAIDLCAAPGGPLVYAGCLGEDLARLGSFAETLGAAPGGRLPEAGRHGGEWAAFCASAAELLLDWPRLPAARGVAEDRRAVVRDARERARKTAQGMLDLFLGRPEDEIVAELRQCRAPIAALAGLVCGLDENARRERVARGMLDFGDFEHYTLALLRERGPAGQPPDADGPVPSALARELQERYDEVLVDEYQDINDAQREILELVSRGNLFCIGDDKQSIYRFRGTNPAYFRELRVDYGRQPGRGRLVGLTRNFRSRRTILDAANFVFRQIMTMRTAEIDYDRAAFLEAGSADYEGSPDRDAPVEIYVLERGGGAAAGEGAAGSEGDENEPQLSEIEREAEHVAARILAMVGHPGGAAGFQVYDKSRKAHRPVSFGDVAVLMRAIRGRASRYLEVFARRGIPVRAELSTGYFAAIEVETMLSLLEVIDNPRQDIPLAAVLRSPLVGLDEPALAAVRLSGGRGDLYDAVLASVDSRSPAGDEAAGCRDQGVADDSPASALRRFLARLDEWRTAARRGPLGDLVWRLFQETDYLAFCGGLPGGAQRQANLLALYERAREFDRFAKQGLPRFLRFVHRLHETESDLGAKSDWGGHDAVLLTSIHKSKGLEFPVVFLPDLGRQMRHPGGRRDVLWHRELGFGPILADRELGIKHPTLAWHIVDWILGREDLAEEMRVLYVAMTRARERMVLSGSVRGLKSRLAAWAATAAGGGSASAPDGQPRDATQAAELPEAAVVTASTYLDWICRAVARHADGAIIVDTAGEAGARQAAGSSDEVEPGVFAGDPSRWLVTLVTAGQAASTSPSRAPDNPSLTPEDWQRIRALRPLGGPVAPDLARALDARLTWEYAAAARSLAHAKLYASELRAEQVRFAADSDADPVVQLAWGLPPPPGGQPLPDGRRPVAGEDAGPWSGPDFSAWGASPRTAASRRGVLTHLVLQHLNLRRPVDLAGLREQVSAMQRASLLSPEDAGSVDLESLAWFFETSEGRTLLSRPDAVRREVPFTLALPAAEALCGIEIDPAAGDAAAARGGRAQDGLSGEMILVQGILDCLVETPDGWALLDFKTDRVGPGQVPGRAAAYTAQIGMYVRAVREILGGGVSQVRLVFLHSRAVWPLSVAVAEPGEGR
ncbi:MAG: helicase-exonuclease AddAB subunit AddA [Bacillota bacterium]|nr:helicase-exonuclease AddAB subunit AddA [Bacillota bacterium]